MTSATNQATDLSTSPASDSYSLPSVTLFTTKVRVFWAIVALFTVAPELLPIGPMPLAFFGLYYVVKVASFLALGYLAPLSLRSLNGIGLGVAMAFLSAFVIESFQGFLHNGHTFHWYELAGKLALIALGFALALDRRYEKSLTLGSLRVNLLTDL